MIIQEANFSLKLECALRELGFMEIKNIVIAHAGIYFVRPVGFHFKANESDDLLGFQIEKSEGWDHNRIGLCLGKPLLQTAKSALDLAISLS